jgi:fructose-bisphosphate aldolase class II
VESEVKMGSIRHDIFTKRKNGVDPISPKAFGAAGMASKIGKVFSLEDMQKRYDKGELDPKVN